MNKSIYFLFLLLSVSCASQKTKNETLVSQNIHLEFETKDHLKLPCILTLPISKQKNLPVAFLLSNENDELVSSKVHQYNMMEQVAEQLATIGIASFRYQNRKSINSQIYMPTKLSKKIEYMSLLTTIDDAKEAFKFLKDIPLIDNKNILILGSNQGADLAYHVAIEFKPKSLVLLNFGNYPTIESIAESIIDYVKKLDIPQEKFTAATYHIAAILEEMMKTGKVPKIVDGKKVKAEFDPIYAKTLYDITHIPNTIKLTSLYKGPVFLIESKDHKINVSKKQQEEFLSILSQKDTNFFYVKINDVSYDFSELKGNKKPEYDTKVAKQVIDVIKSVSSVFLSPEKTASR